MARKLFGTEKSFCLCFMRFNRTFGGAITIAFLEVDLESYSNCDMSLINALKLVTF